MNTQNKQRIGIALGSGSARGWAHIGVLRTLERNGNVPDIVIAVDLSTGRLAKRHDRLVRDVNADPKSDETEVPNNSLIDRIQTKIADALSFDRREHTPSMLDVVAASINIIQMQITRSLLAAEPADVTIAPHLSHFALLDFHRAIDAIVGGERATRIVIAELQALL